MGVMNITSLNTSRQRQRSRTLSVHEPIPDSGQVLNSTGGYTWEVNDWDQLQRFLILGVEGGTYYIKEPELLKSNCSAVERCIKADGLRVIREIVDVSTKGRAFRNDPAIFALALCTAVGDEATKQRAYSAIPDVCRITSPITVTACAAGAVV
jgi:60 kDa SS-A/Ro ribonucleoprotein